MKLFVMNRDLISGDLYWNKLIWKSPSQIKFETHAHQSRTFYSSDSSLLCSSTGSEFLEVVEMFQLRRESNVSRNKKENIFEVMKYLFDNSTIDNVTKKERTSKNKTSLFECPE